MDTIQKSEAIKAGLRKGFQDGTSKMAQRKCYGYDIGPGGELVVDPNKVQVVRWIFERYLAGDSLGKIVAGLERQGTLSPTGRPNGIGRRLTNCSPMKNTPDGYCSRKQSAPARFK